MISKVLTAQDPNFAYAVGTLAFALGLLGLLILLYELKLKDLRR
ncbi:MAG: hypothetical protein QXJ17_01530 [Nitrososphaeria archaeon]